MNETLFFKCVLVIGLNLLCFAATAQRQYTIQKVANNSIKVDGYDLEEEWTLAETQSDFVQTVPEPGKLSRYKTEIKLAYSNQSLYVFARMYQAAHEQLRQMTARDALNRSNADVIGIFLDPYNDKQNGFVFKVSSAGVQQDERSSNGNEGGDIGWDAVWHSHTQYNDSCWTVEMEVPFSMLRFPNVDNQRWGLNIFRSVRFKNESSYWNEVNPQQAGFLAQSGVLQGIQKMTPPARLFLFPYLSAGYLRQPDRNTNDYKGRMLRSGGMDLKYGINESFTLDMTLIPDFSQVISDNIIRNLSPFEQQLTENRPFFTEGTELFNKSGTFYSRRIGERPSAYYTVQAKYSDTATYRIDRNPNVTPLLNAFKLSGRSDNNLGIGVFNSLSAPVFADITNVKTGEKIREQSEFLKNYNVFVLDRPFKHQSFLNLTNTNVLIPAQQQVANVAALRWVQFDKTQTYRTTLQVRNSTRFRDSARIGHYLMGEFAKVSGRVGFVINTIAWTPTYNQQDMGLQFDYNHSEQNIVLSYNENKPKTRFIQLYRISNTHRFSQNIQPYAFKSYQSNLSYFILFKNWWDVTFEIDTRPFQPVDFYQLRRWNKRLYVYPYFYTGINGSSDSRKKIFWAYSLGHGVSNEKGAVYTFVSQSLRKMFGSKWEVTVGGSGTFDNNNIGYSYFDATIQEPIVARRYVREYSGDISLKWNINPDMNLTGRFRHYNARIDNRSFHRTDALGAWRELEVFTNVQSNENYNLQNIDVFFNWMFRPGSRIVLSYKQWLNDAYILNEQLGNSYMRNVFQIIRAPKSFECNARVIFFLDYNKIKLWNKKGGYNTLTSNILNTTRHTRSA